MKNESLQLKLVHRLHADRDAPWPRWAWNAAAGCTPTGHHWSALEKLMPIYRSITTSVVGDGRRTAFWLDAWLDKRSLCSLFPALFCHTVDVGSSVMDVMGRGVRAALVPRLTVCGETQLQSLLALLGGVVLRGDTPDVRSLSRCKRKDGSFDAAAYYQLRTWGASMPHSMTLSGTTTPPPGSNSSLGCCPEIGCKPVRRCCTKTSWRGLRHFAPSVGPRSRWQVTSSLGAVLPRVSERPSAAVFQWMPASTCCIPTGELPLWLLRPPQPSLFSVVGTCGNTGTPLCSENRDPACRSSFSGAGKMLDSGVCASRKLERRMPMVGCFASV
jgi:hypothetical protein